MLPNGTCVCSDSIRTQECLLNCSGHGICSGGSCICHLGFVGPDCALQEAVVPACPANCSGRGTCLNESCACDAGWTSDDCSTQQTMHDADLCPANCSGRGSCINGSCSCDPGLGGAECTIVLQQGQFGTCSFNCSGRGACVNSTCACDMGFSGAWCQSTADAKASENASAPVYCPSDCGGHGVCHLGVCICDPLYTGASCDQVLIAALLSCPGDPFDCSGHGSCVNGTCICDVMWDSEDCSVALDCLAGEGAGAQNATCQGQGPCYNGTCACGIAGAVQSCAIASCPADCAHHGVCINGTCMCDSGWTGPTCTQIDCPAGCSGQGTCSAARNSGIPSCVCDAGWVGLDCSVRLCPSSGAGQGCNGNGACTQNGTCICYSGWAGVDCSILTDCSSRGKRSCGFCVCVDGFTGDDCEVDVCADSRIYSLSDPTDYTKSSVCSGRGRCTTSAGCVCDAGWAGAKCDIAAVCPKNCSGQGTCSGSRDSTGSCTCDLYYFSNIPFSTPRFAGQDCSIQHCPGWIRGQECSGRGTCKQSGSAMVCDCFLNPADSTTYSGPGCNRPPQFFFQNLAPAVGPLEGGTVVTLFGPGIELILGEFPGNVFCSFGGIVSTAAYQGTSPDSILCDSPSTSVGGTVTVALVGSSNQILFNSKTKLPAITNQLNFLYFAQTRVLGLSPTYAPLRPTGPRRSIGPWDSYGPNKDGTNVITVLGSYFPPGGSYWCKFGDCNATAAAWIDAGNLACTMPPMAKALQTNIYVSSNGQQYSNTGGQASAFTVWAITSVSPVCGDILGSTLLTVYGNFLVDTSDATRDPSKFYCRFGLPTGTGQVLVQTSLSKKVYAYYSQATPSSTMPGALVCAVPDWPVEEDDFALSLDAVCGVGNCNQDQMDGYYIGQWDAADSIPSAASYVLGSDDIPAGVKFSTFYHPLINSRADIGIYTVIFPSIGPSSGGSLVTITGYGFDYARYGPLTPNEQNIAWTPEQLSFNNMTPRCSVLGLPSYSVSNNEYRSSPAACLFGMDLSTEIMFVSDSAVVCVSPPSTQPVSYLRNVVVEVALDGQTFTTNGFQYQYVASASISKVIPSFGDIGGGTLITVEGKNFVEGYAGPMKVMQCVFILSNGNKITTFATLLAACPDETASPCTAAICSTPLVNSEQRVIVDISISGEIDASQLTGSRVSFFMFSFPTILSVAPLIGPLDSIDMADRTVLWLLDIDIFALPILSSSDSAKRTQCGFGDSAVPASLEILNDGALLKCIAPVVDSAQTVPLQMTFNGLDWASSGNNYSYFTIPDKLSPSAGPISGGTLVTFGPFLAPFHISAVEGRFGIETTTFSWNVLGISFNSPINAVPSLLPLYVRVQSANSISNWILTKNNFLYYDASQAISSLFPCMPLSDCSELVVPSDGKAYPITVLLDSSKLSLNFSMFSELASVSCGFWTLSVITFAPVFTSCAAPAYDVLLNVTALQCTSPPILSKSQNITYILRISLNGQDYEQRKFKLIYTTPPVILNINPNAGLKSGGMKITLSMNFSDLQRNLSAPTLYSCLFYNAVSKNMRYVPVDEIACNPSNKSCYAFCTTPDVSSQESISSCSQYSIFFSLNRKDPCFSDGCQQVCSTTSCTCSGLNSSIFAYNDETNGWCSPCNDESCNGECFTSTYSFFFYSAPVFLGMSPQTIGGQSMRGGNQMIPITLFGIFAECLIKDNVKIRATFIDGDSNTTYETTPTNFSGSKIVFQLPIPCSRNSSISNCKAQNGLDPGFRQRRDMMIVFFLLSLNNGSQYSATDLTLKVYNSDSVCPQTGCGHGTCLSFLPNSSTAADLNMCLCGYWGQTGTTPVCGVGQGTNLQNECSCLSNYPSSPQASCPSTCSPPNNSSSLGAPNGWFCSKQSANTPSFVYGPEYWPDGFRQFAVDCSASPSVRVISPSVGFVGGGTKIRVTLSLLGFAYNPIGVVNSILKYATCFFDGVISSSSMLNITDIGQGDVDLLCLTPKTLKYAKLENRNITMQISFQNLAGIASPLAFPTQSSVSTTFLFVFTPVIKEMFMLQCTSEICTRASGILSAPTCDDELECRQLDDIFLVIEGVDFLNVSDLVCCYTQGAECPSTIGSSISHQSLLSFVTRGEYINPTSIRCPLVVNENAAGYYTVAVSLNMQEYSNVTSPAQQILFYFSPLVLDNISVTWNEVQIQVNYGVTSNHVDFFRSAPATGGSIMFIYLCEPCNAGLCSNSTVSTFSGQSKFRFVSCPKPNSLLECQCSNGKGFDSYATLTDFSQTDSLYGEFYVVSEFVTETPDVSSSGAGQYLLCFALNGIFFLPLQPLGTAQSQYLGFSFYKPPLISGLSPASGLFSSDLSISKTEYYEVFVTGENFNADQSLFIFLCYSNPSQGATLIKACPFGGVQIVDAAILVLSSSKIMFQLWGTVPQDVTSVNVTLSFNDYDFTPMRRGMTEFHLYRTPSINSISPAWGLFGYETTITLSGGRFENLPLQSFCIFSKCFNSTCIQGVAPYIFRAVVHVSSSFVICNTPSKPPVADSSENSMIMFVSYTPSGQDMTQSETAQSPLWTSLSLAAGASFFFANELNEQLQVSSNNLPTLGGTLNISVIEQYWCPQWSITCSACMRIDLISTLFVGLAPAYGTIGDLGVVKGQILSQVFRQNFSIAGIQPRCQVLLSVSFPDLPYPMAADLQVSFDGGQNFAGPAARILVFLQSSPSRVFPERISRSYVPRPSVSVYFSGDMLRTPGPSISSAQAAAGFSPSVQPCITCFSGPRCIFRTNQDFTFVVALFVYDQVNPYFSCVVPQYSVAGIALIFVSFDGLNYLPSNESSIYLYDEPFVHDLFPNIGSWTAKTPLVLTGTGFLGNGTGWHQTWCIFDFQDLLPVQDQWDVPRMWSKAFPICDSEACLNISAMTCTLPAILMADRPEVPQYPRARVGLIVDGFCSLPSPATGDCLVLKNSIGRGNLMSNAFVVYSDIPILSTLLPRAGLTNFPVQITVFGNNFIDTYTWGPPRGVDTTRWTPVTRTTLRLCKNPPNSCLLVTQRYPCPALTCKFGRICNCPGNCIDWIANSSATYSPDSPNQVICSVPLLTGNLTQSILNVSISQNGESIEFSNSIQFKFLNIKLKSSYPTYGSATGGGLIYLPGDGFINVSCSSPNDWACLHCRFQQLSSPSLVVRSIATFVNSTLIICLAPSITEFGISWWSGTYGKLPPGCGIQCLLTISVSYSFVDPGLSTPLLRYSWVTAVLFHDISANSSTVQGNVSVRIFADNLADGMQNSIICRFGTKLVFASNSSDSISNGYIECVTPEMNVPGQVDFSLSTNNVDFCYLIRRQSSMNCVRQSRRVVLSNGQVQVVNTFETGEPLCDCVLLSSLSSASTLESQRFVFHDSVSLNNIEPPSGVVTGGTEILISGVGFHDYGQAFHVYFGSSSADIDLRVSVLAQIINDTSIRCFSPAMPNEVLLDDNGVPYNSFIADVAVPIQVSSNAIQYTGLLDGSNCIQHSDPESMDNKKANCTGPFVMYTWFLLPNVTGLEPIPSNVYQHLDSTLYPQFQDLPSYPQGPTSGGTEVTLSGDYFISMARAEIINGAQSQVQCKLVDGTVPYGQSCTTTCDFPFAVRSSGSSSYTYNYGCVNLKWQASQTFQPYYWCAVGSTPPSIFSGAYGICRNDIALWRDYNQGGKIITSLECRFGDIHVPATIVQVAQLPTDPVLNRKIICVSPPFEYGTLVPLSVTFNRRDYSVITLHTYFQYLKPAPIPTLLDIDSLMTFLVLRFDVQTNMGGQRLMAEVPCRNLQLFGDGLGLDRADTSFLGLAPNDLEPTICMWSDRSSLTILQSGSVEFTDGSLLPFKKLPCDDPTGTCWPWNSLQDYSTMYPSTKPSDVLVSENTRPGCKFPEIESNGQYNKCDQSLIHSYEPFWCGHCLPSGGDVNELSYPLNRSTPPLRIELSKFNFPAPLPIITGPSCVDSCQKRCVLGTNYGTQCIRDSDCNDGSDGGLCKIALAQLDARQSLYNLGKPFLGIRWSLDQTFSGKSIDPPIDNSLYNGHNMTTAVAEQILNPTFFPLETDLIHGIQYCFWLTITNWVGIEAMSSSCFSIYQSNEVPCPQIVVLNGNTIRDARYSQDLVISTSVVPSPCASGQSLPISYHWSIFPHVIGWESQDLILNQSNLVVAAFTLPFVAGQVYTFTLNATMTISQAGLQTQSNQFNIQKMYIHAKPTVIIAGGNFRTATPAQGFLILDVSASFDPDIAISGRSSSDLKYCWSCGISNGNPCRLKTSMNTSLGAWSLPILSIPSTYFDIGTMYIFQVSVSRDVLSSCRSLLSSNISLDTSSETIRVQAISGGGPMVSLFAQTSFSVSSSTTLRLDGTVEPSDQNFAGCPFIYSWSIVPEAGLTLQNSSACGLVELVVPPKSFPVAGTTSYTVQLSASQFLNSVVATASFTFPVAFPPKLGSFEVSPRAGTAMRSIFQLTASNWQDYPDSLPLKYQFTLSIPGNSPVDLLLSQWTERYFLNTVLPPGSPGSNFSIIISVQIRNALGASAPMFSQEITSSFDGIPPNIMFTQLAGDLLALTALPRDDFTDGQFGIIALGLMEVEFASTRSAADEVQARLIRESMVHSITGRGELSQRRRLLHAGGCATTQDASSFCSAVDALKVITDVTEPGSLTHDTCLAVLDFVTCYLNSGNDLAANEQDYFLVAESTFSTIKNCLNFFPNQTQFLSTFRTLSIAAMKFVSSIEPPLILTQNGAVLSAKRRKVSDETFAWGFTGGFNITIPSNLGISMPGDNLVDVYCLLIQSSEYKIQYGFDQVIYGHVMDISVHAAYQQQTAVAPQVAAAHIANISDISVKNLVSPIKLTFLVEERPELNLNSSSGVFHATVCGFYNETSALWIPFGPNYVSEYPGSHSNLSKLDCLTPHLTGFATLPSQVGCNLVASANPVVRDTCCLCDGNGTSCCDWRRISSANNVANDYPCIAPASLDNCLVCNGENNKPFVSLAWKNLSGICDFRGLPCSQGLIPNACGVCDLPANELIRKPSEGLCDCSPNPLLPTEPGGGLVVDRCGICNGKNASMDDCGSNPNIPSYSADGLYQVCHGGGRGSAQVPTWDITCKGCDNVSRPDLPYVATRRPYPGGVQFDVCGVCGGNGTSCPGCDGIAGSRKVRDICRVCGGQNISCIGCDNKSSPLIKIKDGCHVCGGTHYGACIVWYNYSFTQTAVFSQLIGSTLSPRQDVLFEVTFFETHKILRNAYSTFNALH